MAQLPSSLSLQSLETCGSFWLSVAFTMAWPTFLAALSFIYVKTTLTYKHREGGKVERGTLLGVIDHHAIAPGAIDDPSQIISSLTVLNGICPGTQTSSSLSSDGLDFTMVLAGFGNLKLIVTGYPILNFFWPKTGDEALHTSVQLVRKMIRRPVLEEENISWSKIVISVVGFVFGLVGLLRNPSSLPAGLKSMVIAGVAPDIRVFLLANTVTTVISFVVGLVTGLISRAPSAREASHITSRPLKVIWSLLCVASFGVGCWQINTRRTRGESVWPMFIYWAPATSVFGIDCCGIFDPIRILGMAGVLLAIIVGSNISCHQGG